MRNLAAGQSRSHSAETARDPGAEADEATKPNAAASRMIAGACWLMIISGLTTRAGGRAAAPGDAIVALPKGAHVSSTSVAGDHMVVTLDNGGATEIRTFDVKTLKETGRLRFATEP